MPETRRIEDYLEFQLNSVGAVIGRLPDDPDLARIVTEGTNWDLVPQQVMLNALRACVERSRPRLTPEPLGILPQPGQAWWMHNMELKGGDPLGPPFLVFITKFHKAGDHVLPSGGTWGSDTWRVHVVGAKEEHCVAFGRPWFICPYELPMLASL